MKKVTHRDNRHPWNHFKEMKGQFHRICTKLNNKEVERYLGQIPPDARPDTLPKGRAARIELLEAEWERNYRERFLAINGFPLEDTLDKRKFKRHFRRFRRKTKLRVFIGRIIIFIQRLFSKRGDGGTVVAINPNQNKDDHVDKQSQS